MGWRTVAERRIVVNNNNEVPLSFETLDDATRKIDRECYFDQEDSI